jgi:hypothetical protein
MASGLRIIPESLRLRESIGFSGSYQILGAPLLYPACLLKFVNQSNVLVTVSWDGIHDHDVLPANSFALYDICSDAGTITGLYAPKGTQFWIKGSAGAGNLGSVYLVAFHTSEDI